MVQIRNVYDYGDVHNPSSLLILLHGLGSNGQDLISLAPLWAPSLPGALFLSPDAPFPCDMAPVGYQWFSLQDRDPKAIGKGIQTAFPLLWDFILEQSQKYNVPLSQVVLIGFSQGTMMSLYTAPRLKETIAGVLGYSGALYGAESLGDDMKFMPIQLVHGTADDVVPFAASAHAQRVLSLAGYDVHLQECLGLGHSIDQVGVDIGQQFLKRTLG